MFKIILNSVFYKPSKHNIKLTPKVYLSDIDIKMQISRRLTRLKILATSYFESAERQSLETFHQGQT